MVAHAIFGGRRADATAPFSLLTKISQTSGTSTPPLLNCDESIYPCICWNPFYRMLRGASANSRRRGNLKRDRSQVDAKTTPRIIIHGTHLPRSQPAAKALSYRFCELTQHLSSLADGHTAIGHALTIDCIRADFLTPFNQIAFDHHAENGL